MLGRGLVWLFNKALSVQVDGSTYVPDWDAISAFAGAVAAVIGLFAIWYSIRALRQQLRHQSELEMKQLEQELLVKVMNLAAEPYNAALNAAAGLVLWRETGGPAQNPSFLRDAGRQALEAHRSLATATATALAVLRRSRRRRFPQATKDEALEKYDELVQLSLKANGDVLAYVGGDFTKFSVPDFQTRVGATAFDVANLLQRVTAELLARMYAKEPEWRALKFAKREDASSADGRVAMDFAED